MIGRLTCQYVYGFDKSDKNVSDKNANVKKSNA